MPRRSARATWTRPVRVAGLHLAVAVGVASAACDPQPAETTPPGLEPAAPGEATEQDIVLAFRGVRVFDGEQLLTDTTVLVGADGTIAAVGPSADVAVPEGAELVDGAGRTLLPGLIDAHTHANSREDLKQALVFGVTTELDMFANPTWVERVREREAKGKSADLADLSSAGTLATAPGGHGTEYGTEIPTLTRPEQAAAFVAARIAEGSDYIKIVYDDGATFGIDFATLDAPTLAALIEAAHEQDRMAVVHIGSQQGAIEAVRAGADGLAHIFFDEAPTDAFIAAAHEREGLFVTDTLAVCHAMRDAEFGAGLADDPRLRPFLTPTERLAGVVAPRMDEQASKARCEHGAAAVRALHEVGVPILASTDVPNGGMQHGVSLHGELALLVDAGLAPAEALAAATSAPAAAFGLDDRGRIAAGMRADLVLVEGDPSTDITATRAIVDVYKQGLRVDRQAQADRVRDMEAAVERHKQAAPPEGSERGRISSFEGGKVDAEFGAGWQPSTDALRGGQSVATLEVVRGGANRSKHALQVSGTIDAKMGPLAWAGAMFFPGAEPMKPVNLSAHTRLSFSARGDTGSVVVMVFAAQLGMMPLRIELPLDANARRWKGHTVRFDELGIEPYDVTGIYIGAPSKPGTFELQIDDVRLERAAAPAQSP